MQLLSPINLNHPAARCQPVVAGSIGSGGLAWNHVGWGHRDQETLVLGCEGWALLSNSAGRSWDTGRVPRSPGTIQLCQQQAQRVLGQAQSPGQPRFEQKGPAWD